MVHDMKNEHTQVSGLHYNMCKIYYNSICLLLYIYYINNYKVKTRTIITE